MEKFMQQIFGILSLKFTERKNTFSVANYSRISEKICQFAIAIQKYEWINLSVELKIRQLSWHETNNNVKKISNVFLLLF